MQRANRLDDPNIRKLCLLSRLRLGNEELRRFVLLAYIILSLGLPGDGERESINRLTLSLRRSYTHLRKLHPPGWSECIDESSHRPSPWKSLRTCCAVPLH